MLGQFFDFVITSDFWFVKTSKIKQHTIPGFGGFPKHCQGSSKNWHFKVGSLTCSLVFFVLFWRTLVMSQNQFFDFL